MVYKDKISGSLIDAKIREHLYIVIALLNANKLDHVEIDFNDYIFESHHIDNWLISFKKQ